MKLARVLVLALATALSSAVGCSADDPGVASQELTDIAFVELDVAKHAAPAGLTVVKSTADFEEFFGESPPASVDFKRHWVVHLSAGIKNTGGYRIEIASIQKQGSGAQRKLVVRGHETAPGPDCFVTQALTNPQMTVRINKQASTPQTALELQSEVRSCGNGPCEDLGGQCKSSPIDVTFPANCQADFAMQQVTGAQCPAMNQACCLPVRCGGIAARPCPDGAMCVDDPTDNCDPNNGGADCGGVCTKKIACGGFAGLACPDGMSCVDDPSDECDPDDGGADCIGVCAPEPACDPELMCTQVITCVDGKLYPTGCGPANCDEPTGDC